MGTCIRSFILCYLLLYPHYAFAFDHVTIVKDTIDKEFDNNIYQNNSFSQHHILMLAMGLYMNIKELFIKMFIHIT